MYASTSKQFQALAQVDLGEVDNKIISVLDEIRKLTGVVWPVVEGRQKSNKKVPVNRWTILDGQSR